MTVNEWVIEIQLIHSNGWFIQKQRYLNVLMSESLNHLLNWVTIQWVNTVQCSETKTVLWSLAGTVFVGKIEQKQAILCLKWDSLIALLNLYKMIIKCVMLYLWKTQPGLIKIHTSVHFLCDTAKTQVKYVNPGTFLLRRYRNVLRRFRIQISGVCP